MKQFDVVGIGSPLLDFIFEVDETLLSKIGLQKGSMNLITQEESQILQRELQDRTYVVSPGGSAANTVAGASALGGKGAFIGIVGNDEHGQLYTEQTLNRGVEAWLGVHEILATGHALTFVTPDGERTFATHLGASQDLRIDNISEAQIASAKFLHLEGYQLDSEHTRKVLEQAIDFAKNNDTQVSLDLSDAGVIERNFDVIQKMLEHDIDIVFMNELEAMALAQDTLSNALAKLASMSPLTIVKVGEKGSHIFTPDASHKISAFPVTVVNTNGAGDMYAGAFLYSLAKGHDTFTAGNIASFSASRVVAQDEARLNDASLAEVHNFLSKSDF